MKKFEITKEQLKSIIEAAVCNIKDYVMNNDAFIDDWIKDEFTEDFKTELECGKWYKRKEYSDTIFCYNGEKDEFDYACGYGFVDSVFIENNPNDGWGNKSQDDFIEATPEEIETALVSEAKKRGYMKGVCFDNSNLNDEDFGNGKIISSDLTFDKVDNGTIWCKSETKYNRQLFINGKWATIIETITIQEAEKLLNKKIL